MKKTGPYQHHRENQRERILDAAERLFIRDGIDGVSLSDIARELHITRNTVYEYFPNKQEVAWAILQKIFALGRSSTADLLSGNGFQRIEHFMLQMASQVETLPEHLRFIVEFNILYAREADSSRMRHITMRAGGEADFVAQLVRQGIVDGSIRPNLDPEMVSAEIWNLLSGMNARFALLGNLITEEYGRPMLRIYHGICRTYLRGIQANPFV
jgi:AcrR family transcriptional regulator